MPDFLKAGGIIWIQHFSSPWLDRLALAITMLGSGEAYLLMLPFLYWLWNRRRTMQLGVFLMLDLYTNSFLKYLLAVPRPHEPGVRVLQVVHSPSFPSGHAQGSIFFWGFVGWLSRQRLIRAAVVLIVILIGLSRVYLGVHYPLDVLGGWAIGLAWLYVGVQESVTRRIERTPWRITVAAAIVVPFTLLLLHPRPSGLVPQEVTGTTGAMAGILVGWAMAESRGLPLRIAGPWWYKAAWSVGGVALLMLSYVVTGGIMPGNVFTLSVACASFVRMALIAWEIAFLVPWAASLMTPSGGRDSASF